jgi:hypothetical protein
MTVVGQSRGFGRPPLTSGLARSADILGVIRRVSKVPPATSRPMSNTFVDGSESSKS